MYIPTFPHWGRGTGLFTLGRQEFVYILGISSFVKCIYNHPLVSQFNKNNKIILYRKDIQTTGNLGKKVIAIQDTDFIILS